MPLKRWVRINPDVLPEDYDPAAEIEYVDIGSVDQVRGIEAAVKMYFSDAPSRARRLVRDGDTIVSTVRTYLKAVAPIRRPPPNLVVSTGFAVLRPKSDADPGFLGWLAQSEEFVQNIVAHSVGVSYPAINPPSLGALRVRFPSIGAQRAIAEFLDRESARIDELIAKKERLIELLEERRLSTIDSAVDGRILGLPQNPVNNRWYPDLPSDWHVIRVKYMCSRIVDGVHHTPEYVDEGVPFVTVKNLTEGDSICFDDLKYITPEDQIEFSRRTHVEKGDVLITKDGTLGVPRVVETDRVFNIFVSVALLKPIRKKIDSYFLRFALESKRVAEQFAAKRLGSGLQHLHLEEIGDVQIPLPPRDVQVRAVRCLRDALSKVAELRAAVRVQTDRLLEYRTALISAAVTGQIDVRTYRQEPEAVLEESV